MKRISGISATMVFAVAAYFAFTWGLDATRVFTSPTFGLDDALGSQVVFALGHYLGLAPAGLIKLGAVLGALKGVVAVVCALHVIDRLRTLFRGSANLEVAQAGFMLAVSICVVALLPMIVQHNPDMLRDYAVDLALAGVAAALAGSGRVVAKTVAPKSLKNFDLMTYEPAAAGAKPRAVKPIDLATFDARDYVPKTLPAKPGSRLHV
jgi:hypothetical protein